MFSSKLIKAAAIAAASAVSIFAAFEKGEPIQDGDIAPGAATHYKVYDASKNLTKPYYLQGTVIVDSGCTMVIRPGTWIYGLAGGDASRASNLVVAPGGYIDAQGTVDSPIVFTGWGDDQREPDAFGPGAKALWGGIILIGNADISDPDTTYPEGIERDVRCIYGKTPRNNADNSGIMKYVSIRHGGTSIASNSEVNGLSFYGVGSGTEIDYVEVYSNYDDGYEWFGGTVNCKHLVSAFNLDDGFDLDDGYRGNGQFWFGLKHTFEGDKNCEWDGCQNGQTLWSAPTIYNMTLIGSGSMGQNAKKGLFFADSLAGIYRNSIVTGIKASVINREIHPEGANNMPFPFGYTGINDIILQGFVFWDFDSGKGNNFTYIANPKSDSTYLKANNHIFDPMIRGIGRNAKSYALDPRLAYGSNAHVAALPTPAGSFWTPTTYKGAFDSTNLWIDKWTAMYEDGLLSTAKFTNGKPNLVISPATSTRWKKEYAFPLQLHLENTTATPVGGSKYIVKVDGVKIASPLFAHMTGTVAPRVVYQWYFSQASNIVPYSIYPTRANAIVGPHVIDVTMPLSDGSVLNATSRIWLF